MKLDYSSQIALQLQGIEYGEDPSKEVISFARLHRCIIFYGCSDDLIEVRGYEDDEYGAFGGVTIYLNQNGIIQNQCEDNCCPYFRQIKKDAKTVKAVWCDGGHPAWTFETNIPHATFEVLEDDSVFCIGIVICLDELE